MVPIKGWGILGNKSTIGKHKDLGIVDKGLIDDISKVTGLVGSS